MTLTPLQAESDCANGHKYSSQEHLSYYSEEIVGLQTVMDLS